uniref:Uncharacterized protein n=1 Tax=Myripristis murdjan TaxID=586833 RepID=A0A668AXP6_9TELE
MGIPTRQNETPIEREIRRAVEREHSLRRSRGLQNPPISPEYVEIPLRKSVISQSLPAKSERTQDKDRHFAGKKMQQEIYTEAQREQALVKLGKVPGVYDKGTFRQLKERKKVFEAFQGPKDSSLTISTRSKAPSWSSASEFSTLENQEDISSPCVFFLSLHYLFFMVHLRTDIKPSVGCFCSGNHKLACQQEYITV